MNRKKTVETMVLVNVKTDKHVIIKRMVWRDSLGNPKEEWFRHGKIVQPMFLKSKGLCTITTNGGRSRMTEYLIVESGE
jgi:hypothetical protein